MTRNEQSRGKNGFSRTRKDHASEQAEDYVEAIAEIEARLGKCRCADLARLFGVSHVTVVKTIARLEAKRLVQTKPYAPITLTRKGCQLAKLAKQRHELVLEFLLAIGVDSETARADAEGIEHHVSPATLDCFRRFTRSRVSGAEASR
jgi:DtxR family manganese transport transcriptional regulator